MKFSTSRVCARAVMDKTGMAEVCGFSRKCASVIGPSIRGIMTSSKIKYGDHSAASANRFHRSSPCR
jgi:hypothetical protein